MSNELQYYKNEYSKFWEKQTKIYGYGRYEQYLVKIIAQSSPKKVFEVGIGTGWPIGVSLKNLGVEVDGCDIADSLVCLARENLDNEKGIYVGDVMEYDGNTSYDVTYCVRVSWYIPDFYSTIQKMISMTKPGGYVVFDFMNKNSFYCFNFKLMELRDKYYRLLGIDMDERHGLHFISVPKIKKFLAQNRMSYQCIGERVITNSKDWFHTPKIVFLCRKEG
ncbi:MAG: class I SAM-dependent methyltransferase [Lachnospiraceae bacterium]|nr:class I SAM-dependent methyltransferase [Lachnospiraceae bacterium]